MSTLFKRNKWWLLSVVVLIVLLAAAIASASPVQMQDYARSAGLDAGTNVINKVSIGGNGPFQFTWSSVANGSGNFTLDTTAPTPGFATISSPAGTVNADVYTYVETVPTGWMLTNLVCDDPYIPLGNMAPSVDKDTATAMFQVEDGETVQCTFTNTKLATLTITKVVNPAAYAGSDAFEFTLADGGSKTITIKGETTSPVEYLTPGTTYTLDETGIPAGFSFKDVDCTGASQITESGSQVTIVPAAGDTIACTYTNDQWGKIEVTKRVVDPDTAANSALVFHYDISDTPGLDVSKAGGPQTLDVPPGEYDIAEVVPAGWTDPPSWHRCFDNGGGIDTIPAHVVVDPGEKITCYYDNYQKRAKITVEKVVVPGTDSTSFAFTTTGSGYSGFGLSTVSSLTNAQTVLAGDYTVQETDPGPEWDTTTTCEVVTPGAGTDSAVGAGRQGTITVSPGAEVKCTVTNTKRGHILVEKWIAGYPTAAPWCTVPANCPDAGLKFSFEASFGNFEAAYNDTAYDSGPLTPGAYSLKELGKEGWRLTGFVCTSSLGGTQDPAAIDLKAGEILTCDFTNTKLAKITVLKEVEPDTDTTKFAINVTGPDPVALAKTFTLGDDESDFVWVLPGSGYSVAETAPTGWDAKVVCKKGATTITLPNVLLVGGDEVICTVTNTKWGKIIVVKKTAPVGDLTTQFLLSVNTTPATAGWLVDGASMTVDVHANTNYNVTETIGAADPYVLASASCDNGTGGLVGTVLQKVKVKPGDTTICTFENHKLGTVKFVKKTVPAGDAQVFTLDLRDAANATIGSAPLMDTQEQTFSNLVPNVKYGVAESFPAGWYMENPSGIQCVSANTSSTFDPNPTGGVTPTDINASWGAQFFTLGPGDEVTCTLTNMKKAKITVTKVTDPAGAGTFPIVVGGPDTTVPLPKTFNLSDGGTGSVEVLPGSGFSVAETAPSGWNAAVDCGPNIDPTDFDLAAGQEVSCRVKNVKLGHILVEKWIAGYLKVAPWCLDPDPLCPDKNTKFSFEASFGNFDAAYADPPYDSGELMPGPYTLKELDKEGWRLTGVVCNSSLGGTQDPKAIDLKAGEILTCDFTNTKLAKITVLKEVEPDTDTTKFDIDVTGPDPVALAKTFTLGDDESDFVWVLPGSGYSVAETAPTGWDAYVDCGTAIADPTDFAVVGGDDVTCTVTNVKQGTVKFIKKTLPAGDPQVFTLDLRDENNATIGGAPMVDGDVYTSPLLTANKKYGVAESFPAGWFMAPDGIKCVTANGLSIFEPMPTAPWTDINASWGAQFFTLAPGDEVTCTLTNIKKGTIIIQKESVGGKAAFEFDPTWTTNFFLDTTVANPATWTATNLVPGPYGVQELAKAGYDLAKLWCDDGTSLTPSTGVIDPVGLTGTGGSATIGLDPGETVTCFFVDNRRGRIRVVKTTEPVLDPQKFDFTLTGPTPLDKSDTFKAWDGQVPTYNSGLIRAASPYSVVETVPAGWELVSKKCDNGDSPDAITVKPGQTVTCTFVDIKQAQVIVKKVTIPDPDLTGTSFPTHVAGGPDGVNYNFSLKNGESWGETPAVYLKPGPGYWVEEEWPQPEGWQWRDADCRDDAGNWLSYWNMTLAPGQKVTCTFTNIHMGKLIVKKVTDPATDTTTPFQFDLMTSWWSTYTSFSLVGGSEQATWVYPSNYNGTYTLLETVPDGWVNTGAVCDNGSPIGQIAVLPGEEVTCTFTNQQQGQIIIEKVTNPVTPLPFNFSLTGGPSGLNQSFSLMNSGSHNSGYVKPGNGYVATELTPLPGTGWALDPAAVVCSNGSPITNIDVAAGQVVTCVFKNVNPKPTKLALSKTNVPENKPVGTLVGYLTATDPGDVLTYALSPVDGTAATAGNNFFQIVKAGTQWKLLTKISFDYERQRAYSIKVRVTDSAGNFIEKQFTISILNVLDPN